MFLKIDDDNLNNLTSDSEVQEAAQNLKSQVKNLKYDYQTHEITAIVEDNSTYNVNLRFDSKGSFDASKCNCSKQDESNVLCKHALAVIYMTREKFLQKKAQRPFVEQNTSLLPKLKPWLNLSEQKKFVNSAAYVKYYYDHASLPYLDLEIKLGVERLYTIKEVRKLLDSIETYGEYPLGKVFAYDFYKHDVEESFKKLLLFLLKINKTEKSLMRINEGHGFMWNTGTNPLSCFKGKVVRLGGEYLVDYFDTMLGATISFSFNETEPLDFKVVEDDVEITIDRALAKEGMMLSVIFKNNIVPLMPDYSYVMNVDENLIIKMPREKGESLGKLFTEMTANNSSSFIVTREHFEEFNGIILPYLKKNNILITTSTNPARSRAGYFLPRVHFDITRKGIVAGVRFCYGKTIINPLSETKALHNYIANRNQQKEALLLNVLYDLGFDVQSGRLLLDDVNKIAEFIKDDFEKLKDRFEYTHSEKYGSLKIVDPEDLSFEVIFEDNKPVIKFKKHFDDVELSEILTSVNLGKKYHLCRNAELILIDKPGFKYAAGLLGRIGIPLKEIHESSVHIPINKLPFIPTYFKEKNIDNIELSEKLLQMVDILVNPANSKLPPTVPIQAQLRDYQITGFNWLKTLSSFHLGGILADDMGLGKTLQVLAFIMEDQKNTHLPSLVVAPTSLIFNWYDEAVKFVPDLKVCVISGTKNDRMEKINEIHQYDLVVTSFGLLKNDIELYENKEFAYCIVDEAQNIKNPQTLNADSVKKIKAKCCFALTGTPVENNLTELWSIFDFVLPGHLPSYNKFIQKFDKPISKENDKKAVNLLAQYIKPFVLRRLKKEVLTELPDKIESVISTRMTPEQEKLYFAFLNKGIKEIKDHLRVTGFEKSRFEILALLTRLRQICSHPSLFIDDYPGGSGKLELLFDLLENSLRAEHRMLIFSQFSTMLDLIKAGLEERNIEYFSLDGKTPSSDRTEFARRFNEGEASVFLISLKAGGTGLNLIGADIVVHFDPWWNPAVEDQASDRAYRIGQTKAVQIFKLITHNSIEEKIYELQLKKKDLISSVIKSGDYFEDTLSEAEILEVLGIS